MVYFPLVRGGGPGGGGPGTNGLLPLLSLKILPLLKRLLADIFTAETLKGAGRARVCARVDTSFVSPSPPSAIVLAKKHDECGRSCFQNVQLQKQ